MTTQKKQHKGQFSNALLFTLLSLFSFNATSSNTVTIEPILSHSFGSTWFRMQVTEPIANPEENFDFTQAVGESELEYPLDVITGGVKIGKTFNAESKHPTNIKVYLWRNLNDPKEKMQDSDWFGAKNSNVTSLYKFSYTQSTSDIDWAGGELQIESEKHILLRKKAAFGIKLSADYSYHRMYGVKGWQKLPDIERVEFDDYQNQLVLTYKLLHIEPSIYTTLTLKQKSNFRWQASLALSPIVLAKDKDDHVLRNKNSETTAYGYGLSLNNQAEYIINKQTLLKAAFEIHYFRTEGKMNQRFYGDDPFSTDNDETGLEFKGINNVISMFTQQVSLSLEHTF